MFCVLMLFWVSIWYIYIWYIWYTWYIYMVCGIYGIWYIHIYIYGRFSPADGGFLFHQKSIPFSLKAFLSLAALPPAGFSQKNDSFFLKSLSLPCGAASGGLFSQRNDPFSLNRTRCSAGAHPVLTQCSTRQSAVLQTSETSGSELHLRTCGSSANLDTTMADCMQ